MRREKVYCAFDSNAFNEIVEGKREGVIENNLTSAGIVRKAYYWRDHFEDGDILYESSHGYEVFFEFKKHCDDDYLSYYRLLSVNHNIGDEVKVIFSSFYKNNKGVRLASADEIMRFNILLAEYYPFKDGDILSHDVGGYIYLARFKKYLSNTDFECHEMVSINTVKDSAVIYKDTRYTLKGFESASIDETRRFYKYLNEYKMAKFEFKPFDKVLVRLSDNQRWRASLYSHRFSEGHCCMGLYWKQCIPYNEKTAKLLGTTDKYEEE